MAFGFRHRDRIPDTFPDCAPRPRSFPARRVARRAASAFLPLLLAAAPLRAQVNAPSLAATGVDGGAGEAAAPSVLPPVVVEGQRAARGSGSLDVISSAPIATTPLAIDVIDAADLLDRGVNSLSSAIRVDPSVGDNYNTFGYIEALQIRGFTLNELLNYQRDGMTVSSHVPVALENKESIEILKGASGMLEGASAPGGLVNYVLKQPTDRTLVELDATVSERGSLLLHGDFGGRAGDRGQFGYRINVAAEERQPEIDRAWSKRAFASGFFDWRVTADTQLQFEFEHQKLRAISVPGYALLDTSGSGVATTLPPPIDPWINLNAQTWTQPFESTETSASLRLHQRLGADWELSLRAGTQRSVANDRIAFPDGCSTGANYLYNGICGNYDVDVYQYISDDEVRNTNDTDTRLQGRISAWGVSQELTFGLRTTRYAERYPFYQTYNLVSYPSGPVFNVFAPVALPANPAPGNLNTPVDTDLDELYAFDTARFAHGWSTWLGARFTRITESSSLTGISPLTGTSQATALQQHLLTPWFGLGYEPWHGGFAYASAGSGVEVSNAPNHPDIANSGQVLPAQRSRQAELGFKQQFVAGGSLEAALFRIDKPFTDNLPLPGVFLPDGTPMSMQVAGARKERHQGLELTSQWQASATVHLRASATWMDARTTQAIDPTWVGKAATNVPPLAVSVQESWAPRALPGLAWLNVGTYAGHKAVLPDGSVDLPDYWQWDTALRYVLQRAGLNWTLRAGIDNVTNRSYWRESPMAPWGSIYLFPAAARSGRLGVSLTW
jgi:iron complex outermembrane receptor protein